MPVNNSVVSIGETLALNARAVDPTVSLLYDTVTNTMRPACTSDGNQHVVPYYWNTNTLSFEVALAPSVAASSTVAVTNFPTTQSVTGTFWQATQPVSAVSLPLPSGAATEATLNKLLPNATGNNVTLRFDAGATYTYIGYAPPGSSENAAVWQIKRMDNTTFNTLYAGGTDTFTKVWADRAGLSYS